MTSALDMCHAARRAWEKRDWQLTLEDSAPDRDDGNPHAASLHSQANPGPSTSLARTDGGPLPCYGRQVPGLEERRAEASSNPTSLGRNPGLGTTPEAVRRPV